LKHRRLILIYLIASNICLGRFPSSKLLMRREAADIAKRFLPLCKLIAQGDLGRFHQYLDPADGNETARWLLNKRVLLQLMNRCEILVWRSLIRKTFIIAGYKGEEKKVPFVRLPVVRTAAIWALKRSQDSNRVKEVAQVGSIFGFGSEQQQKPAFGGSQFGFGFPLSGSSSNTTLQSVPDSDSKGYTDPEFDDLSTAITETGFDPDTGLYHDDLIGQPSQINGDAEAEEERQSPTLFEIESIMHSLIQQGLLKGFVTHASPRFAIPGAKAGGGALATGFPSVWGVIASREGSQVPGWVRDLETGDRTTGTDAGGGMGGRVIRLSGARPAGAGLG
jgi:nuclear mRNA export protein PCID2/THP1